MIDPTHALPITRQAAALGISRRHRGHPVFPYLLRHLDVTRPDHVGAMDITYIPMVRGCVYLAAVLDRATRRVLITSASK